MKRTKIILIRILYIFGLVAFVSYLFDSNFYFSIIVILVLGIFFELIHYPENLPGSIDNPEGERVHPLSAILIAIFIIIVLLCAGAVFPGVYSIGFDSFS